MKLPKYLTDWDRKSIIAGMMIGLILTLGVDAALAANEPPCTIALKIKTVPDYAKAGLRVVLMDGSIPITEGVSNPDGEVIFELGNMYICKVYTAVIMDCEDSPSCTRSVEFNPMGFTVWDINTWVPPTTTTPTTTTPTTTTTTTTTLPPTPSGEDLTLIGTAVISLFAVVGGALKIKSIFISIIPKGWGVQIYKGTDGTVKVLHKHPGLTGYHDADTVHKNASIRHPKGKVF